MNAYVVYSAEYVGANREHLKNSKLTLGDILDQLTAFADEFKNVVCLDDREELEKDSGAHKASTAKDALVDVEASILDNADSPLGDEIFPLNGKTSLARDMEESNEDFDLSSDGSVSSSDEMAAAYVEMASLLNDMDSDFDEDSDSAEENSDEDSSSDGIDNVTHAVLPAYAKPLPWTEKWHPDGSLKSIMTEDSEFKIQYGFYFTPSAKVPEEYLIQLTKLVREHVVFAEAFFEFAYEIVDVPLRPLEDQKNNECVPWIWTLYRGGVREMIEE